MHRLSTVRGSSKGRVVAIAIIALLAVAACGTPVGTSPPGTAATSAPAASLSPPDATALNRGTAAAWVKAAEALDAAVLAALYAPDGTFDDPPEHRPDRAGVQATYTEVFGYEQLAVDPAVVLVGEDGAVVGWTYTWCNTSIAPCPSQHVTTTTGVSVFRMVDGVITNETIYYIGGGEPS